MSLDSLLAEIYENRYSHIERYELDKNGIATSLKYQIVTGILKITKNDDEFLLTVWIGDEYETKCFSSLFLCLDFLKEYKIEFEEIVPSNLQKMFTRI